MQNKNATIKKIAQMVQQHYMKRFCVEYRKLLNEFVVTKNQELFAHSDSKYCVDTDVKYDGNDELSDFFKTELTDVKNIGREIPTPLKYRQDIVVRKGKEIIDDYLVWPIIHVPDDKFDKEDIPYFPSYKVKYNKINLEIQPFPWNHCEIVFSPNANVAMGFMVLWFQKWFYPTLKPNPFKQVIHLVDGPYLTESVNEVSYYIDFGTAPPEAFCELIELISRCEISSIIVK